MNADQILKIWNECHRAPTDGLALKFARAVIAAAAPQVVADERAVLNEIADLFSIGAEARKERGVILANVRNTVKFANLLHAVEREFFMSPDDENECLVNCWGSTTEQYLTAMRTALQAASVQAQEPVAQIVNNERDNEGNYVNCHIISTGDHDIEHLAHGMKLYGHPAPVQPVAVPDDSAEKANFWFDCLYKCAKLLELDDHTPVPSGVVAAVEKLIAAPAAQGDTELLNFLAERIDCIIYLDDGRVLDLRETDLRTLAMAAKAAS